MMTPKSILIKENKKLNDVIASNSTTLIENETLRQENDALRKELSYAKKINESILAEIIAKPNRSLYNSLIINRGSDDGIMIGQRVTSQGTIGLGEIAAVSKNTATVVLYSSPQFSGDLVIKNEKNIFVPAIGKGSGNFEIHIPREITIVDGDLLALPEYQNMIVGVVKSVTFDPRDPFQTVLARTPVNVQELRFVEVIK
jgi:rod shape-determining protein MreC